MSGLHLQVLATSEVLADTRLEWSVEVEWIGRFRAEWREESGTK
jgi:hypothetical protein